MAQQTIIKKIRIFPIEALLEDGHGPQKVSILKLNTQGMILEVFNAAYRPQAPVKIKFTLPLVNIALDEECLIVKTYNQLVGEKEPKKQYLLEIHFKKLNPKSLGAINDFLEVLEAKIRKAQEAEKAKKG